MATLPTLPNRPRRDDVSTLLNILIPSNLRGAYLQQRYSFTLTVELDWDIRSREYLVGLRFRCRSGGYVGHVRRVDAMRFEFSPDLESEMAYLVDDIWGAIENDPVLLGAFMAPAPVRYERYLSGGAVYMGPRGGQMNYLGNASELTLSFATPVTPPKPVAPPADPAYVAPKPPPGTRTLRVPAVSPSTPTRRAGFKLKR